LATARSSFNSVLEALGALLAQLLALVLVLLAEALDGLAGVDDLHSKPSPLLFLHHIGEGFLAHAPVQHRHHAVHLLPDLLS
jgi:hypothetical protein